MNPDTRNALAHLRDPSPCGCVVCERAAIYEYEAGLSRAQAEWRAAGEAVALRDAERVRSGAACLNGRT